MGGGAAEVKTCWDTFWTVLTIIVLFVAALIICPLAYVLELMGVDTTELIAPMRERR